MRNLWRSGVMRSSVLGVALLVSWTVSGFSSVPAMTSASPTPTTSHLSPATTSESSLAASTTTRAHMSTGAAVASAPPNTAILASNDSDPVATQPTPAAALSPSAGGVVTNYTGTGIDTPLWIAAGPDGALWFTNYSNSSIGRITTAGVVTKYTGTGIDDPDGIAAGSDGALWFTNSGGFDSIGRITTAGVVTNYTGTDIDDPGGIAAGPDGALWFTNSGNDSIGRIGRLPTIEKNASYAGYEDVVTQANYFHFAEAEYTEPSGYASSCVAPSVAIWTGLGADSGSSNGAWAQAGTSIGKWGADVSPNEAWVEMFGPDYTQNGTGKIVSPTVIKSQPIYATPGSKFEVSVERDPGTSNQWSFFFKNFATGQTRSVTYSGPPDPGPGGPSTAPSGFTTAQFIVENEGLLENFHTINFDSVGVADPVGPITDFPYKEFQLYQTTTAPTDQLATTGPLTNGGRSFSVTQDRCKAGGGH